MITQPTTVNHGTGAWREKLRSPQQSKACGDHAATADHEGRRLWTAVSITALCAAPAPGDTLPDPALVRPRSSRRITPP